MDPVSEFWFQRIDAHMERGNELMQRVDVHMERNERAFDRFVEADDRNTAAFDRNTAAFERWEAQQDEMREFMREITLRVERSGREHSREIRRMGDEVISALREGREEFREEMRAQRAALVAILDRLQPGDSGSAA